MIFLETSSYLPLIWTTPYSRSVVDLMRGYHEEEHEFALQQDCIVEAAGYLAFNDDWRYNPAVRIRRLLERFSDVDLARLGYPSAAIQLLLGGNIWPQAKYLNYVRHTAFLLADLMDGLDWTTPRSGLSSFADRIDQRLNMFRRLFQEHLSASFLTLPRNDILPYWGKWYLLDELPDFRIRILKDPRPCNKTTDESRDVYHYDCAANNNPSPELMIVADTGFARKVKSSFSTLPMPIVCAKTMSVFS